MKVNNEEYNTLLDELSSAADKPFDPETEVTASILAERIDYSRNGARVYLEGMVKSGALTRRTAILNGKKVTAYRKVKND